MEASCPLQTPAVGISSVGTDHRGRIGIRERKRYGEAAPHVGDEGGSEVNQTGVGRTFNASVCNARRRAPKLSSRSCMRTALQSFERRGGRGIRFFRSSPQKQIPRRSRRRPPRNDRIGYGAAVLEKMTDARLWRGGRGLWSTFSCSVVDVGSRSRRFGFRDRQAGDPQPGGVDAMLDVESDQEGGDVLHDARVLQVPAVDGANTRNLFG